MDAIKRTCSIEGCERKHYARSYCHLHYRRWKQHGDPLVGALLSPPEAFWAKVEIRGPDECWPWLLVIRPIPAGLTIDHTCHNADLSCVGGPACQHRRCCNPAHLEAVTMVENHNRASARNGQRTHCKHGHPLSGDNLYEWRGMRKCRTCRKASDARQIARRAALWVND